MSHAFPVLTLWKPNNREHTCNKKERVTREHAYLAKGMQENTKKNVIRMQMNAFEMNVERYRCIGNVLGKGMCCLRTILSWKKCGGKKMVMRCKTKKKNEV